MRKITRTPWTERRAGDRPEKHLVHTANVRQLQMMAEHFDCDLFIDATSDEQWSEVTFTARPKRSALRVVGGNENG